MRLTQNQRTEICNVSAEVFGTDVGLWLFGSRLDDVQCGGDIDILIDIPVPVNNPALLSALFSARVSRLMQGRKVDVLLSAPNLLHLPIHDVALREGQKL